MNWRFVWQQGAKQSRLKRLLLQDSIWMLAFGLGLGVFAAVKQLSVFADLL